MNMAGKLELWETALALKQCTVLFSNDSSLGHMAEAVGTPTAVLFGPTIESFGFAPRMPQSRAFSANLGCRPCSKHGKVKCRYGDKLCFAMIGHSRIASFLAATIEASPKIQGVTPV